MDPNRKLWNQQQQALLRALARPGEHQTALELFLSQHAMLHSAKLARSKLWSALPTLTGKSVLCRDKSHITCYHRNFENFRLHVLTAF